MRLGSMRGAGVLAVSLLAITACTGQTTSSAAPDESGGAASEAPVEKVTIRLTTWAGEDESAELQELVLDKINAEQSEFEIIHEPAPADYYTKVQTGLAGGTAPDLMWLSQEYIAGFASRGALLDVTELVAQSDLPAGQVDSYFPDVIKTARYQDGLYGLPWIAQPVVLYYNPALFDEAGIDYPDESWDWDTFLEASKALTTDADGDGVPEQYGFSLNGWPPLHMFIWQAGGEVIADDLGSSPIDSPEAIAAAEFYSEMIFSAECCPSEETLAEQGFSEMFKAGTVAMFMGGASDTFDGLDVVGASVVPSGPANRTTFSWTASTAVNSATEHPEIAARALVALTEGIHHWKIVAPRTDLLSEDVILASIPEKWKAQKEPQLAAIIAAAEDMSAFNIIPRHQEWDDLFWKEFQDPLYHDQGTAAELAAAARAKLEDVMR